MKPNPFAPPRSTVADQPEVPPDFQRPTQVSFAVTLLWISFILGFPLMYFGAMRDPETYSGSVFIGFCVTLFAIYAWMIFQVKRGKNWARICVAVLIAIGAIDVVMWDEAKVMLERAIDISSFAIELVALYLLFSLPGKIWFGRRE